MSPNGKGLNMRTFFKKSLVFFLAAALFCGSMPFASASYTPPVSTVRIGLYYGSGALDGANLENSVGSGYRFGYYDADRNFVSVGYTDETAISMVVDRNVYYSQNYGNYFEGNAGSTVVGCYHIQLSKTYGSYDSARSAADTFTSVNAYVKYSSGNYYVCVGEYISSDAAKAAGATLNIAQDWDVTSGTAYTVAVVKTGTDKILFEFEYGTAHSLGVMPRSGSAKAETYFKGYRYYGGFQYARLNGGDLTVVNFVGVEDYVKGVIPYEMSASWPVEALKAQAVCARTYLMAGLNGHSSNGFDLCNTTCCQVYRGLNSANANSNGAVDATAGEYLLYAGQLCQTFFYSSNGGASESSENVWYASLGYLKGKTDPYEAKIADSIPGYYWTETYTAEELTGKLQNKGISIGRIVNFEVTQFTPTGNVYTITFTDENGKTVSYSKERVRTLLGFNSMRYKITCSDGGESTGSTLYVNNSTSMLSGPLSKLFGIGGGGDVGSITSGKTYAVSGSGEVSEIVGQGSSGSDLSVYDPDRVFTVSGSGSGHNVGLSQWGAYSMAKYYDKSYRDILSFYYTGAAIEKAG